MNIQEMILIIDFGSQVTQLIARRVREHGVYSEIHPYTISLEKIRELAPKAIILSGGPASVAEQNAPTITSGIFSLDIPILGICYGQQLLCNLLGGKVESSHQREFGHAEIMIHKSSALFDGIWQENQAYPVWMSHGDRVVELPTDFCVIATTTHAPFAAIAHEERKIYGVQFHPEVTHTEQGSALLKNFIINIAGCQGNWNMGTFIEQKCQEIKETVGQKRVICGVSGGVDSSVVAALLHRAIGNQVQCIFVNTGLLRHEEAEQVKTLFDTLGHIPLIYKDASALFLGRLKGISDPEQKRKIIGHTFIEVFEEEAKKISDVGFLAQGTLYPDVIESISATGGPSVTIKSHHNVGGLPERLPFKLIEPVRELFKDEVRRLGTLLGMPTSMVERHPFPGPGLAIRIPGEITAEKIAILQKADAIYLEEIRAAGLYNEIWQAFAVLLPVKTVGVMGDNRTYEYVCALRAVTSIDGMTADYYPFDHRFLRRVSNRIVNEVRGINRIVYDVTSKPPGTIEWE